MNNFKLAILFITCIQATNDTKSILDVAQAALDAANEVIGNILNDVHIVIDDINIAIRDAAVAATQVGIALISDINDRVLERLEEIKYNSTNGDATAIIDCIEDGIDAAEQVEQSAANGTTSCIERKLNDALNAFETIWDHAAQANEYIKQIQDHLTSCEGQQNVFECVAVILQEIVVEVAHATDVASDDIETARALFLDIGVQIDKCGDDQVDTLLQQGNQILVNVGECIGGSLESATEEVDI